MSVINGAQTMASCAAFADENKETTISSAFVPITVIQADRRRELQQARDARA